MDTGRGSRPPKPDDDDDFVTLGISVAAIVAGVCVLGVVVGCLLMPKKPKIVYRSDAEREVTPLGSAGAACVPKYWTGFRESKDDEKATASEDLAFDELHYAPFEGMKFFQELLNKTYKDPEGTLEGYSFYFDVFLLYIREAETCLTLGFPSYSNPAPVTSRFSSHLQGFFRLVVANFIRCGTWFL